MPYPPAGIDPEAPGTRFTLRPALAVYGLRDSDDGLSTEDEVKEVLGEKALQPIPGLGEGTALRGGVGLGGEGWAAVIEWIAQPAVAGVIGALTWEASKAAARALADLIREKRPEGKILVSRGAAVLIAVDHLLTAENPAELVLDAVDEPTAIGGHQSPQAGYANIEPWVVLMIDPVHMTRYVVIVSPGGEIRGHMKAPMEAFELDYRWSG
jgi:hypothetical protein